MFSKLATELIVFVLCVALIVILLCTLIVLAVYKYQRKQALYLKEIQELKSNYDNNILSSQLEIQEQTLRFISQEIHDNVGQKLTLAKLYLNTIDLDKDSHVAIKVIGSLNLITESISTLREMSRSMSADSMLNNGLIKAIDSEISAINKSGVFTATFSIIGEEFFLAQKNELVIFRIVQECINNFIKHSGGKHLNIILEYNQDNIQLVLSDDGNGIVNLENLGGGISNMRNRTMLLGGKFDINSSSSGVSVSIVIPTINNTFFND